MESNEHQPEFFREKETRRKIIQKEEKKRKRLHRNSVLPLPKIRGARTTAMAKFADPKLFFVEVGSGLEK